MLIVAIIYIYIDHGPNIKEIYEQRMQESKEIQTIHVQEQASTKKLRCEYSCHLQKKKITATKNAYAKENGEE